MLVNMPFHRSARTLSAYRNIVVLAAVVLFYHPASAQQVLPSRFVQLNEDGWNVHQGLPTEGGAVFLRAIASSETNGQITVVIGGTQANLLSATFSAANPAPVFTPFGAGAAVAAIPAFKWFNGVTFNGPIGAAGTLGFANGYHGLLLETTNGGVTWTDLTNPNCWAELKADIASIAIAPVISSAPGATIAVAGSLSPNADSAYFPPLHYATEFERDH